MKAKQKPIKVQRITCPTCGELLLKVYPWASFGVGFPNNQIPPCKKCLNNRKMFVPDLSRQGMVAR